MNNYILHQLKTKELVIKKEYKKINTAFKLINTLVSSIDYNQLLADYKDSIDNKFPYMLIKTSLKKQAYNSLLSELSRLITDNPYTSCDLYNSFYVQISKLDSSKDILAQVRTMLEDKLLTIVNNHVSDVNDYLAR